MIDWLRAEHAQNPYFPLAFCLLCGMAVFAAAGAVNAWRANRRPR